MPNHSHTMLEFTLNNQNIQSATTPPIHPEISVVIPLFNKAPYVSRTLASALAQISPASEIIVVDDGSTDGGGDLVAETFPDVRLVHQTNKGEGGARNTGVAEARFDWVAFLDADDLWYPNHLLELRRLIRDFNDAHLVGTAYSESNGLEFDQHHSFWPIQRMEVDILRFTRWNLGAFWTSALAVRKTTLQEVGGFTKIRFGADIEAWLKVGMRYECAYSTLTTATYMTGNPGVMEETSRAHNLAGTSSPLLQSVTDLPGISTVLQAETFRGRPLRVRDERRYVNGRLTQALRIALRNGHDRQADLLRHMFDFPVSFRSVPYLALAYIPAGFRATCIGFWVRLRRGG